MAKFEAGRTKARRGRGVAASRLHGMSTSQPRRRRDSSPLSIHASGCLPSDRLPRRRRLRGHGARPRRDSGGARAEKRRTLRLPRRRESGRLPGAPRAERGRGRALRRRAVGPRLGQGALPSGRCLRDARCVATYLKRVVPNLPMLQKVSGSDALVSPNLPMLQKSAETIIVSPNEVDARRRGRTSRRSLCWPRFCGARRAASTASSPRSRRRSTSRRSPARSRRRFLGTNRGTSVA